MNGVDFATVISQLLVQAPAIAILLYQNYRLYTDAQQDRNALTTQIAVLIEENGKLQEQVRELSNKVSAL